MAMVRGFQSPVRALRLLCGMMFFAAVVYAGTSGHGGCGKIFSPMLPFPLNKGAPSSDLDILVLALIESHGSSHGTSRSELPTDLSHHLLPLFALVMARVSDSKVLESLRSVFLSLPLLLSFNKFPCMCSTNMSNVSSAYHLIWHASFGAHLDAWIWKQASTRRGHVLHQFIWLLPLLCC
ncbi:hypothetical protein BRADI_3g19893v3 [Brachypodium distachyon]|uniref:Uncharacterized protein n=1 Tax=Brachypodium distachyon TaxID=15368 RepID=A0A0Q3F848_BRADI|nr:hypothetical protein BRADI_3g19893v3 [Brachypodium distachyon]